MERYADKYLIMKTIKCNYEDDCEDGWIRKKPIAVVDSYDDAKEFISNNDNFAYHLRLIHDGVWEVHPGTNETHRIFYKVDDQIPFEGTKWYVTFDIFPIQYYK